MKTVHTVKEYLALNEVRRNVLSCLSQGVMVYLVDGVWTGQSLFDEWFPKAEYKPLSDHWGDNPCRKNNYLNNTKSY